MSFHRTGKYHSIAGQGASYTIEQARLELQEGQHEDSFGSFHGAGVRGPVFARFLGAIPVAADQADRADSAGRRPRYLGAGADSMVAINPHLYKEMQTDPLKDLAPVASVVSNHWVLSVNPSVPVRNFKEFVEYARQANPPLAYASGGNGSIHQLAMEMLKQRASINLIHVPYKGGAPAATATVAGEVAAMFSGTSSAPQIKAGRLRALAMTGAQRSALFPDLPTISEFYPGYEVTIWLGLFAAAGTPEALLAKLHAEVNKLLAETETKARLNAAGGLEAYITTAPEFAALIRRDYDKYGKLVRDVGVKVD